MMRGSLLRGGDRYGCRDLCKSGEELKKCKLDRYLQGFKFCITCEICYNPDERLDLEPNPHVCYCCGKRLRSRSKNKSKYQDHLVRIV